MSTGLVQRVLQRAGMPSDKPSAPPLAGRTGLPTATAAAPHVTIRFRFPYASCSEPANQRRLRDQDLRAYAETLGLDVELFDKELAEHVHAERIHEDFLSGVRSGVNGTPSFYINCAKHDGSYEL